MRLIKIKKKQFVTYLLLLLPLLLFIAFSRLNYEPIADEKVYFETSKIFGEKFPKLDLKNYFSYLPEFKAEKMPIAATPPLSMLLYGFIGRSFGYDLWKLRLLTAIFGIVSLITFYCIMEELRIKNVVLKTMLFLFYPYTFLYIFTAQTDIIAICFFLLGLRFFLRNRKNDLWLCILFSTLAIYTRQDYLFIVPAMMLGYLFTKKGNFLQEILKGDSIKMLAILSIPFLLVLPLFIYWGGLLPSSYSSIGNIEDKHTLAINFEKFTFFFILIGFFFPPLLLDGKVLSKKRQFLFYALLIFFVIFPITSTSCEGIVCKLGNYFGFYSVFLYLLFFAAGAYILLKNLSIKNRNDIVLLSFLAMLIVSTIITSLLRQRYYLAFIPLLVLILYKEYDNKKMLGFWLLLEVIMSILYVYSKIFWA